MQIPSNAKEKSISERYQDLAGVIGGDLALYCLCATLNLPVMVDQPVKDWESYLKILAKEKEKNRFLDGITDIDELLVAGQSPMEQWESKWGTGDEKKPYTESDYKRMDEIFYTLASGVMNAGMMDEKKEYVFKTCARLSLLQEKCIAKGDSESITMASKLDKMIQDNLASEQLRGKDEKPVENLKIDSVVVALENSGLYKDGKILPLPELQEQLLRRLGALGGKPSHKYKYTLDAADQMLFVIANTMYANDDLPEISELPDNMRLDKNVESEFEMVPDETEQYNYEKMGLLRNFGRSKKE